MTTTRKLLPALLLALVAGLGTTCCRPPLAPDGLAVVGDSVTEQSTPSLQAALPAARVHGIGGIDLPDALGELVRPAVGRRPEVLVVELGINSARDGWTSQDLGPLEATLRAVDPVPCTVWVVPDALEVSDLDAFGPGTLRDRIALLRASLVKRLPDHPTVHLADWGATERQHPEWYKPDGIHPNRAGQDALAAYIARTVHETCR